MSEGIKDLKSCPFCGGEAFIAQNEFAKNVWRVQCKNCDASPSGKIGEDAAIAAWNRRAPDYRRLFGI